jgi:GNAT superfamily N-acetyltransferase
VETHQYKIREGFIEEVLSQDDLLEDHWDEVAKNKHLMNLKPMVSEYQLLEKSGMLFCLIAEQNGVIVGYSCNITRPHLHYEDLFCCYNDVIFVSKPFRNSPLGLKLIRQTEKLAKDKGCSLMVWHAKKGTSLDQILPRMRYSTHEIVYSKEL